MIELINSAVILEKGERALGFELHANCLLRLHSFYLAILKDRVRPPKKGSKFTINLNVQMRKKERT